MSANPEAALSFGIDPRVPANSDVERSSQYPRGQVEQSQTTNKVVMVRPTYFGYNPQAAETNHFQHNLDGELTQAEVNRRAQEEFDGLVAKLREKVIEVLVIEDTPLPHTPDAVFPNNWMSTHHTERGPALVTYPMLNDNRRQERKKMPEIISKLRTQSRSNVKLVRMDQIENEGHILEGTGSLVLDRTNGIAYACISPRTTPGGVNHFEKNSPYDAIRFHAVDLEDNPIYHTNVVMSVGTDYVVICLEAIPSGFERQALVESFEITGKEIVAISREQMDHFCGNVLELENILGQHVLVMSDTAYNAFTSKQLATFEKLGLEVLHSSLDIIEKVGGGSARCTIAEDHTVQKH